MKKKLDIEKIKTIFWPGTIYVGVTIVVLAVLYLLMDYFVMPLYTRQHQSIEVPNVTHLSYTAAEKILKKAGLKTVKAGEKYDENFPPGFVLFQNPEAGSPVKKGRRVYLTVGKGQRTFPMPKLVGMPLRDARFTLENLHLNPGEVTYENDNYYPEDVVSDQSVPEGQDVAVGSTIDLTVSLGEEPTVFIVPEVVGKSLTDAEIAIKKAGLTLGRVQKQVTDKVLPNTVIGQSLDPGLEVSKGDTLDIVISQLNQNKEEGKLTW